MRFCILGPIRIVVDGADVAVGGRKQRVVLARLILDANTTVTQSRLIDDVWGDNPPPSARNTLQTYVSQLRKAIGADRIVATPGGYMLVAEDGEIDARDFANRLDSIDTTRSGSGTELRDALAIWRGPALADIADERGVAGDVARLEAQRSAATEAAIDADLREGGHRNAIGELESLTTANPLHEGFWEQLMLAQYRSGRQVDALRTFRRARAALVQEAGVEPGTRLRQLNDRVLDHDPTLDWIEHESKGPEAHADAVDDIARSTPRTPSNRPRHRRIAVIAASIVAVGVGLFVLVLRQGDHDDAPNGVVAADGSVSALIIDPDTGDVTATIDRAQIRAPVEAIYADGSFWILNLEPMSFAQVDAQTGEITRQIASPVDDVGYFAVDGSDLWVTHYTQPVVSRVDIERGIEVGRFVDLPGEGGSYGVAIADESLWVARRDADDFEGAILRLDPNTFETQHEFRRLPGSLSIAADDESIWTTGLTGDVNRIDLRTNRVNSGNSGQSSNFIAAGGGFGWTTDEVLGTVNQIDSTAGVVATYSTGLGARPLSFDGDRTVWVANQKAGSVTGIDVHDGSQRTISFGRQPQAVAAGGGRLLVEFQYSLPAELDGEMPRMFITPYQLEPLDPAHLDTPTSRQVLAATCGGLISLDGNNEPVPELAERLPRVSSDALTYHFTIAAGRRFSPPSNELIDAETFKVTIERTLSPQFDDSAPGVRAAGDIAGVDEFRRGDADHIVGIVADGRDLTIRLSSRSSDFVRRLADPSLCATTARSASDSAVAVPTGDASAERSLASAGPYYIARHSNGEYLILLSNPNYRGPRPQHLDGLALREGVPYDQAVMSVDDGSWDGVSGLMSDDGQAADQFGPELGCITDLPEIIGLAAPRVDLGALCASATSEESGSN